MNSTQLFFRTFALSLLFAGSFAHAATITGTVINKTTGKPAAGDAVVLVDPMAGMAVVGKTTTDARGHYSLQKQGDGPALVKTTHQGAEYFIAAPQGAAPGDLSVYDVAAKVQGVFIEADVIEVGVARVPDLEELGHRIRQGTRRVEVAVLGFFEQGVQRPGIFAHAISS